MMTATVRNAVTAHRDRNSNGQSITKRADKKQACDQTSENRRETAELLVNELFQSRLEEIAKQLNPP